MSPDQARLMTVVEQHLQTGRLADAEKLLGQLAPSMQAEPHWWWSRASLWHMTGDVAAAEPAYRRTMALDPQNPMAPNALGELLAGQARLNEAEECWRKAVAVSPSFFTAVLNLAQHLLTQDRAGEALATVNQALRSWPDPELLDMRAAIHSALDNKDAAIADYRQVAAMTNGDTHAVLRLATALSLFGRPQAAEAEVRKLLTRPSQPPEAWQVLAQALVSQDRLDEAQAAVEKGLASAPVHPGLQRDLAHIVWIRTADANAALARLESALAQRPGDPSLTVIKGKVLEYVGDEEAARAVLVPAAQKPNAPNFLLCAAAQVLVSSDPAQAVALASKASQRAPMDAFGLAVLAEAHLAAGNAGEAETVAMKLRTLRPGDQHGLALLATAWRLRGDDRYRQLYDYERLVRSAVIETPEGWPSLETFLKDLGEALTELHGHAGHPIGQSLRNGTQTNVALEQSQHPAIKAFFAAIDKPVRRYIESLGQGDDPLRSRVGQGYRLSGAWSVRLQGGGGRHVDHLHNQGWLSSAFYVRLPSSVGAGPGGALRLGQPGIPTSPSLEAEHRITPQPGMLVLFPSYMWHGVEPFAGDEPRLTIAFDVAPA